uniref:Uncharacterized protein n=1 Tax=Anguilla anguilla TaxID=7936 RepID=A0A0E9PKM7_ANGAN
MLDSKGIGMEVFSRSSKTN